jgi:hypothetical protein
VFERKGNVFLKLDDNVHWIEEGESTEDDESSYSTDSESNDIPEQLPETKALALPSSLAPGEIGRLGLNALAKQEASLRRGQINDALEGLWMALGEKSLLFHTDVQNSKSQRTSQRAWQNVNKQDLMARRHKRAYDHARKALIILNIDMEYLSTLQDITPGDMKMAGDITEENRISQRSTTLAWFWRLEGDAAGNEVELNPRMKECEYRCFNIQAGSDTVLVYRVNWLRAKARYTRWEEEHNLIPHEMQWTVSYFQYREKEWWERKARIAPDDGRSPGLHAYASKQAGMWKAFSEDAMSRFRVIIPELKYAEE